MWVLETSTRLRDTKGKEDFFQQNHQPNDFKRKLYQQAQQAGASIDRGWRPGTGNSNNLRRRFSASLDNLIGTSLPEVIATMRILYPGRVGDKLSGTLSWWNG